VWAIAQMTDLDDDDKIYRQSDDGQSWIEVNGRLEHIDAASENVVYGVDGKDRVYQYTINHHGRTRKVQWPGSMRQISVGSDDEVWGINANENIYRLDGASWTMIPGNLAQISVGSATNVWGVSSHLNSQGNVFQYNNNGGWTHVTGPQLTHISVGGDGVVMGVDADDNVFVYDHADNEWQSVCGSLNYIEVGSQSHIWGIGEEGTIYKAIVAVSSGFASAAHSPAAHSLAAHSPAAKFRLNGFDEADYSEPAFDSDKFVLVGTWKDIQFLFGVIVFGILVSAACLAAIRWKVSRPKVVYGMVSVNSDTEAVME